MITALLHGPLLPPTEGASSRLDAIVGHLRRVDPGFRILMADPIPRPGRSRAMGLLHGIPRLFLMALAALTGPNRVILLSAPALPFFVTPSRLDLLLASFLMRLLRLGSWLTGSVLVLNLHDIRSLQLPDFGVEIAEEALEIFRQMERRSLRAVHYVLAPGGDWPRYLEESYGLRRDQLIAFPNGCVRSPGRPPSMELPPGLRFVYAGTMTPRGRGLEDLVRAFRRVRSRDASLILLGPGGEWSRDAAGGDPRVHYLGARPVQECIGILRECHVAMYPYPDLFYFAMTHATNKMALYMTCGLPVLATRSKAVTRFVEEHEIGLACHPDEIPARMDGIASNPGCLDRWSANVEGIAGSYYWDVIIDRAFRAIAEREGIKPLEGIAEDAEG
jgi:glycosyltransferase involved in cell wall biosynthesis